MCTLDVHLHVQYMYIAYLNTLYMYVCKPHSSTVIQAIGKHGEDFSMGRSKIFIRSPKTVFELEEHRRKKVEEIATLIQRTYRGWVKRKRVREGRGRRDR